MNHEQSNLRAGFARMDITPPLGTRLLGFGNRDQERGCEAIHDPIYVHALALEQTGRPVLVLAYELCFFGRAEADRMRGALGRRFHLPPSHILLNTSHSHVGPSTASHWAWPAYVQPLDPLYMQRIEDASLAAAARALAERRAVTLWAGETTCDLPVSRRYTRAGKVEWRPYEDGTAYRHVPLCLLKDDAGRPVCLMFSVSCHPSMLNGFQVSAEYPGAALARLDAHLGVPCSLFLQGVGGDTKPRVTAEGESHWRRGTWDDLARAGEQVAAPILAALDAGLRPMTPGLCVAEIEMHWPLMPSRGRAGFEKAKQAAPAESLEWYWADRMLRRLERGDAIPETVPITAHGVRLAPGLRWVGLEGEAVAGLGHLIRRFYGDGFTWPMGYTDGCQLYLPTESMLAEGGYEVESYPEYGVPERLAPGLEPILLRTLRELQTAGID